MPRAQDDATVPRVEPEPEILHGGNTNAAVVRIGDVVRRATGPWTPSVHALLDYLEAHDFPAPRVRGRTEDAELLTYIPGDVIHPDRYDLIRADEELGRIFAMIRLFHELAARFAPSPDASWHTVGADPSGSNEVLCHNDFAPWNLIASPDGWVFIDWDLVAPGRRDWELAWALQNFTPLHPAFELRDEVAGRRIGVSLRAYGVPEAEWDQVLDVVLERTTRHVTDIREGAARGEQPWGDLLAGGHDDTWQTAVDHNINHRGEWLRHALGS